MSKTTVIAKRFVRGFAAGAVSAMLAVLPVDITGTTALKEWLFRLSLAALVGGITGGLLAADKYFRWEDEQGE
jgi:hypothetical protein